MPFFIKLIPFIDLIGKGEIKSASKMATGLCVGINYEKTCLWQFAIELIQYNFRWKEGVQFPAYLRPGKVSETWISATSWNDWNMYESIRTIINTVIILYNIDAGLAKIFVLCYSIDSIRSV